MTARPAATGGDRHPAAAPGVSPASGYPPPQATRRPRPTRRPRLIPPGTRSRCPWRSRRRPPRRSRQQHLRVGTAARIAAIPAETRRSARSAAARRASLRPARCRPSPGDDPVGRSHLGRPAADRRLAALRHLLEGPDRAVPRLRAHAVPALAGHHQEHRRPLCRLGLHDLLRRHLADRDSRAHQAGEGAGVAGAGHHRGDGGDRSQCRGDARTSHQRHRGDARAQRLHHRGPRRARKSPAVAARFCWSCETRSARAPISTSEPSAA